MRRPCSHFQRLILLGLLCVSPVDAQPANQTSQISHDASAHLEEIISILQKEWLDRETLDWAAVKQRVFERAGAAQSIPETFGAIRLLLASLGDKHSYYITASGAYIYNPESPTQSTGRCTPPPFVPPVVPADVGYVRIQI